mmetsp:Transcript_33612/g.80153  ORF Transcript_33612/g.80153 Transcript_33612/m.80153 type:complete len:162 (+) Transcript_33612:1055-1540(+)
MLLLSFSHELEGSKIRVEPGRGTRPPPVGGHFGGGGGDGRPMGPKGGTGENRVLVEGLDEYTSWQDLKDFARRAGNPVFTEVYRDRGAKVGVIEFRNRDDVYAACRALDGMVLHDRRVRVTEVHSLSPQTKIDSLTDRHRDRQRRTCHKPHAPAEPRTQPA